jgi:scytalone dehydratase
MSPAVKLNKEPNLDISFQGRYWRSVNFKQSLTIIDYLILSKLVFDWADSYDAKVNQPYRERDFRPS